MSVNSVPLAWLLGWQCRSVRAPLWSRLSYCWRIWCRNWRCPEEERKNSTAVCHPIAFNLVPPCGSDWTILTIKRILVEFGGGIHAYMLIINELGDPWLLIMRHHQFKIVPYFLRPKYPQKERLPAASDVLWVYIQLILAHLMPTTWDGKHGNH